MGHHQEEQHTHYRGPRRRREKEAQSLFKVIMAQSFFNLRKETDIQIQEAERIPDMMNPEI